MTVFFFFLIFSVDSNSLSPRNRFTKLIFFKVLYCTLTFSTCFRKLGVALKSLMYYYRYFGFIIIDTPSNFLIILRDVVLTSG